MTTSDGQLNTTAARVYDEFFVPALFAEWAPRVADAARTTDSGRALDVACGTGVLARELANRLGPPQVSGVDCNDGMLAVARERAPDIEWRSARAEELPFDAGTFATVASQFGLMFFADRVRALAEMWRVLEPGGHMAVAVWASLDETPGYAAMAALLENLFGAEIASELEAPFCLGHAAALRELASRARLTGVEITSVAGRARFPSIRDWVHTDIRGWTLANKIDDDQYQLLLGAAEEALSPFVTDGAVSFHSPALIMTARKD